jgi:hypothetical protein
MFLVNTDTGLAVCIGTYGCGMDQWTAAWTDGIEVLFNQVKNRLGRDVYWPRPHYILTGEGCLSEAVRLPDIPGIWQLPKETLEKLPRGI